MSQQTRATLKSYFETGDIPTESQFSDLIDSFPNIVDDDIVQGITTNVAAYAGGGQTNATLLTTGWNIVTTVTTNGDSIKLPAATVGAQYWIWVTGGNTPTLYPASGEDIGGYGANVGCPIAPYGITMVTCLSAGTWNIKHAPWACMLNFTASGTGGPHTSTQNLPWTVPANFTGQTNTGAIVTIRTTTGTAITVTRAYLNSTSQVTFSYQSFNSGTATDIWVQIEKYL